MIAASYPVTSESELAFWRAPEGVAVAGDPLRFLYIPDDVESRIMAELARGVFEYQIAHPDAPITQAVMITMGGLLPGVLLHDHLAHQRDPRLPRVEFGTLGVQCYAGPGQPLDTPHVVQPLTLDVRGQVVGVIEDLVDLGGTAKFVAAHLRAQGARDVVLIAPYLKSKGILNEMPVITFGEVPKDTWIITPRERVETLLKRVPYWRARGATAAQCAANLRAIGYPDYLIAGYLPMAYHAEA